MKDKDLIVEYSVTGLNTFSQLFHKFQIKIGFTDSNIVQRLMMVHSEISEAFEAYRKNKFANVKAQKLDCVVIDGSEAFKEHFEANIKDTMEDEIADAMIRLLAFCGENNIDIEYHIKEKMKYNQLRGFKFGGKKF